MFGMTDIQHPSLVSIDYIKVRFYIIPTSFSLVFATEHRCWSSETCFANLKLCGFFSYHRRAKLLNADWLRQRAFFSESRGHCGNQEGMIT